MDDLTQYLKKHPRMIGVLFTIMLALSQTGTVLANNGTYSGT
ncbi:DUF7503 family protein [Natronorubrum halophilum]